MNRYLLSVIRFGVLIVVRFEPQQKKREYMNIPFELLTNNPEMTIPEFFGDCGDNYDKSIGNI